jgi:hypothetical protein
LIFFPLKHYRWMWRFWTKPWRHLLPHCNIFSFFFLLDPRMWFKG